MVSDCSLSWTPLVLVMLIYVAFAMGYGNIPFILMGEILPQESCNLGTSIIFISQNGFRSGIVISIKISSFWSSLSRRRCWTPLAHWSNQFKVSTSVTR